MTDVNEQRARRFEDWISSVLDVSWHREALADVVEPLQDALRERFGATTELAPIDDRAVPVHDVLTNGSDATIRVSEAPWAGVRLPDDADDDARRDLRHVASIAGRILTVSQERWATRVLDDVWRLLGDPLDPAEALPDALERLRTAMDVDLIVASEFRGGAFAPYAAAGAPGDVPMDGTISGMLDADAPSGRAYFGGAELYEDDRPPERPHPHAPPVGPQLAAVAVLPEPRERYAHLQIVAAHTQPHAWRPIDRDLLRGAGRAVRLYLERRRRSELLGRVLELERALLARVEAEPMQLIINALVDIVPGAEAGTILVREGTTFRYAGITDYDREGLSRVSFELDELERWYEDGRPDGTDARLLRAPGGVEAASDRASGGKVGTAGELPRILANLALPIAYGGSWGAFVNLDAFATEHAFVDEDRRLLEAFAPIVGFVLYEADIRRELRRFATHDELTGLLNRRSFDETFRQELRRAERARAPLSVLVLDLDNFKRLNDEFGHEAGDRGLRNVAQALRSTARGSDHVFRWGGDEFALLLPDTDRAGAERMVARLTDAVGSVDVPGAQLGASAGVAVHVPGDGATEDDLLRRADAEMYAAKRRARH